MAGTVTPDGLAADAAAAVSRQAIISIDSLIRPYLRHTPVIWADRADFGLPPGPLPLKLEHLQHTGLFKARGAFANLLLRDIPGAGVVAASGGHHGAAVSYAARALGVPARIYVLKVSSAAKTARIRGYGAQLVIAGDTYADALATSQEWAAGSGALAAHAFDQFETILGAGTVATELARQAPTAGTVLASAGGGGQLAGIAAGYAGRARVVGAEPEKAPTLTHALRAGRPVDAPAGGVAADSLAPRRVGELTFSILTRHAATAVQVRDDAIRHTQELLRDRLRLVAKPGGCTALAALASGGYPAEPGETVAVVISGANTTAVGFGDSGQRPPMSSLQTSG
jgi:threonine dehydratase